MHIFILAFILGIVCGFRALLGLAVVSWAARFHTLNLQNTYFSFFGCVATPYIISAMALGELVNDKLSKTPSRLVPPQFITRVVTGSLSGAAIGASDHQLLGGLVVGAIGAVAGTLIGSRGRATAAKAFGKDLPAALLEDLIGLGLGIGAVALLA